MAEDHQLLPVGVEVIQGGGSGLRNGGLMCEHDQVGEKTRVCASVPFHSSSLFECLNNFSCFPHSDCQTPEGRNISGCFGQVQAETGAEKTTAAFPQTDTEGRQQSAG